jgi:hypothetical protein
MTKPSDVLNRRIFLKSATAVVALPALESVGFARFAAAASTAPPKRLVFLGLGWGITTETWFPDPKQTGAGYPLPRGLEPLARHREDFTIVQGMTHRLVNAGHQGSTFWLTGADVHAVPGKTFHNTVSADQVAARQFGLHTRFASIQLDCGSHSNSGHGGNGLSLAWDFSGKPIGGHKTPVEVFHRLFSSDATPIEQQRQMLARRRSVLDTVLENAADLQRRLGKTDSEKLDEYFQGIREIETRLAKDEQWIGVSRPQPPMGEPTPGMAGKEEIRLMYDLIVAALQTDSTRVMSYRQPVDTLLTSLGISVAPHDMSHYHSTMAEKLDASQRRDIASAELLAHLIDKLKATKEHDGSCLFDHVSIAYGTNTRTEHNGDNVPTLLAGRGAGIKLGHNIVLPNGTPLNNCWLTLLKGSGVDVERHGDSTGLIEALMA